MPNPLIVTGVVAGTALRGIYSGPGALFGVLLNILFPVAVFYLLFLFHMLGAGDIKLFSLVGSFLDFKGTVGCILLSLFVCGIFAALKLSRSGHLAHRLQYLADYISNTIATKKIEPYYDKSQGDAYTIHCSVGILLGTMIYLEVFY